MSRRRLETRATRNHEDIADFFDDSATCYSEQHGRAEALLRYRLDRIRNLADFRPEDDALEIGCGDGLHLTALAADYETGLGVDLSPGMIAAANRKQEKSPHRNKISFAVDTGESLGTVANSSVDVAFCVGSLEHMLDQEAVFRSTFRVLRPGGRLVCLTLNGGSFWYRYLAPTLGIETRQLQTDRYLRRSELESLVSGAGFEAPRLGYWSFVQRGDMPKPIAVACALLDRLGVGFGLGFFRGGLELLAIKPRT